MNNRLDGWLEQIQREEYEQEIREKAEDDPSKRASTNCHLREKVRMNVGVRASKGERSVQPYTHAEVDVE